MLLEVVIGNGLPKGLAVMRQLPTNGEYFIMPEEAAYKMAAGLGVPMRWEDVQLPVRLYPNPLERGNHAVV